MKRNLGLAGAGLALLALWALLRGDSGDGSEAARPGASSSAVGGPRVELDEAEAERRSAVASNVAAVLAQPGTAPEGAPPDAEPEGWPQAPVLPGKVEIVPVLEGRRQLLWTRWLRYVALEGRSDLVEASTGQQFDALEAHSGASWQRIGPAWLDTPNRDTTVLVQSDWRIGAVLVPAGFEGRLEVRLRHELSVRLRAVDGAGRGIPGLDLVAGFGEDGREGRTDEHGRVEVGVADLRRRGDELVVARTLLGAPMAEWRFGPEVWGAGEVVIEMVDVGEYRVALVDEAGNSVGGDGSFGLLPGGTRPGQGANDLLANSRSTLVLGPRFVGDRDRVLVARELGGLNLHVLRGEGWSEALPLPPPGIVGRPTRLEVPRSRPGLTLRGRLDGVQGPGRVTWVVERLQTSDGLERLTGTARTVGSMGAEISEDGAFELRLRLRGSAPVVALRGFGEVAGTTGRFRTSVEFPESGPGRLEPYGLRDLGRIAAEPIGLLAEGVVVDVEDRPQPGRVVVVVDLERPDAEAQTAYGVAEHREWLPFRVDERGHFELWGTTSAARPALALEQQSLFSSQAYFTGLPAPVPFLPGDRGLRLVLE